MVVGGDTVADPDYHILLRNGPWLTAYSGPVERNIARVCRITSIWALGPGGP